MVRVGIPRALLYYQYFPMWQTFFQELGAEVVVSPPTTQTMLASGSARVVAETCLPAKVFLGHVLWLVKKCDFIFIPAIRSVKKKIYNCSKFLGLPDMTRAVIPECPPILDTDIDVNKGRRRLHQAIHYLGKHFTANPLKVRRASQRAWQAHVDYLQLMAEHRLTSPEAIAGAKERPPRNHTPARATIALIGHPYLLYDDYVNHRLIPRLEQAGCRVVTPEMLYTGQLEEATARMVGRAYWTYEEEITGAAGYYLQNGVDGIIGIMAFGCGPDSLMMDKVRREASRVRTIPFMSLTLEEHTAEAGVVTRLEAFVDMLHRRRRQAG
jgi:predicted nucleotide-binding protein (sugar kinase/HSP70/actin superfamily)